MVEICQSRVSSNTRDRVRKFPADGRISCHYPYLPKGFDLKDISKRLSQRIMITYRLLIAIEHAFAN